MHRQPACSFGLISPRSNLRPSSLIRICNVHNRYREQPGIPFYIFSVKTNAFQDLRRTTSDRTVVVHVVGAVKNPFVDVG